MTYSWSNHPLATWLADPATRQPSEGEFLASLCERANGLGLGLVRVSVGLPALHPQMLVRNLRWTRGGVIDEIARPYNIRDSDAYLNSPVRLLREQGVAFVRRRLAGPEAQLDFPILHELRELGATDYCIHAMRFTGEAPNFIAWATDRPDGFPPEQAAFLQDITALISLRFELYAAQRGMGDLLTTYLGPSAAREVMAGHIRRAAGRSMRAAIWSSDLRGFTAMADRISVHELITTLDDYFEVVAEPIQRHGGEILKFIGDGVLATFPVDDDGRAACAAALAAADEALTNLDVLNTGRATGGAAALRIGVGLHFGDVVFGNIGARDRLDFTVIGAAVNEVVRTETMTKALGRPLLATGAFAEHAPPGQLRSVGFHVLRGKSEPAELFGLADG